MSWLAYEQNVSLSVVFAATYLAAAYFCHKDVYHCMLACLSCQIYSLTPLYGYTVDHAPAFAFIVYAAIYFTLIKSLKTYKVMVSCFTMGIFEILMAGAYNDWFSPQGLNDWLYQNYEVIVSLLHAYIVFTLVQWRLVRRFLGLFRDGVVRSLSGNCLPLYF